MKRRRAEESADGLALMTSSVTSSQSADGLALMTSSVTSSQSADGLSPTVARYQQSQDPVRSYSGSSRKIHPVNKIRWIQYYTSNRKDPDARKADVAKHCNQAQSIQSTKISAEDEFSRCHESAAKQLTIYESWMSTAELNSNGENDKKPAKEKDTRLDPGP
ncbi:hypothetical protein F511_29926 [Dorcoceras hygrometricum]|uniref:Uncharacterized protein n=1 Tax=Dorcoceras hygrometricum TaxID=472368 RepID=A0A2Z7AMI4_9LAMI|nr:hypothetical protein F511_29926 [Dorcoceras hygrometricum]